MNPLLLLLLGGGALMVLKGRSDEDEDEGLSLGFGEAADGHAGHPMDGIISGKNGSWKWQIGLEPGRVGLSEPRWWSRIGRMQRKMGGGHVWRPEAKQYGPEDERQARGVAFFGANIQANSEPPDVTRVPPPPPPAPDLPPAPPMSTPISELYNGAYESQGGNLGSSPWPGKWMGWGSDLRDEYSKMYHIWSYPRNTKSLTAFIGMNSPDHVLAWQAFAPTEWRFSDRGAGKRNATVDLIEPLLGTGASGTKPLEVFNKVSTMIDNTMTAALSGVAAVVALMSGPGAVGPAIQFARDAKKAAESIIEPSKEWHDEVMQRKGAAVAILQDEGILFNALWELALWNPWLVNETTGKIDLSYRYKCNPTTLGDLFESGTCPPWIYIPPGNMSELGLTALGLQLG